MSSKEKKKAKPTESESSSDSDTPMPPLRKDPRTSCRKHPDAMDESLRVVGEKEPTWDLGSKKFLTVSTFKGKTYINIREYYTDDKGEAKPGKKGIGLTVEQWDNLVLSVGEVNDQLK